jgi:long-chain acyl-CoA synthetase
MPVLALELGALRGARRPETAVVYEDVAFTGEFLDVQADILAAHLAAHGIGARQRVALLFGTTPAFVVCTLALMKLDAGAVLLGTRLTEAEIADVVRRTESSAILGPPSVGPKLGAVSAAIAPAPTLDSRVPPIAMWRTSSTAAVADDGELFLQLTSGVSGRSKIVPRSTANLTHELEHFAARLGLGARDAALCPCPLSHAYGLVNGCLLPLFSGRPAILVDWFVPSAIVDLCTRYRPRVFVGVPAMYAALSHVEAAPGDLSSLTIPFSAGAPLSAALARAFHDKYGVAIRQQYGSTETGVIAINLDDDSAFDAQVVGRPVQTLEVATIADAGSDADAAGASEIAVRSRGSATRYVGDPALGASKFRNGWYFTGDVGAVDQDGTIRLHGRRTSFINVGGLKVQPLEVEEVLLGLAGVVECAVVGAHDRVGGEVVKAVIVTKEPRTVGDVRRFCRQRLAPHKVPRYVTFVDALPRSATGKVLTKYLVDA